MDEKTAKSENNPEQKSTTISKMERKESNTSRAFTEKPIRREAIMHRLISLRRKEKSDYESGNAVSYNFISKHNSAIRDATATAISVSMSGMVVMFSSGILLDNMTLAYSSLYFAGAGIISAFLLAANSLYSDHTKTE